MTEVWKDIKGYEGLYQVSNLGRVKSLGRYQQNHGRRDFTRREKRLELWRLYLEVDRMINISVRPDYIEVTGHADYAPPGEDIVCAAISALWQTLIESIEALTDDLIEYDVEGEQINKVIFRNQSDRTRVLIDSFFIGVSGIAGAYPDCVAIV